MVDWDGGIGKHAGKALALVMGDGLREKAAQAVGVGDAGGEVHGAGHACAVAEVQALAVGPEIGQAVGGVVGHPVR